MYSKGITASCYLDKIQSLHKFVQILKIKIIHNIEFLDLNLWDQLSKAIAKKLQLHFVNMK